MPSNKCSNCLAYSFDCTYLEAAKKRGPSKGYVERLENRLEKLESLLNKLGPDETALKELDDGDPWPIHRPSAAAAAAPPLIHPGSDPRDLATHVIRSVHAPSPTDVPHPSVDGDDDFEHIALADELSRLKVVDPIEQRYLGKSSGAMLVRRAFEVRNAYQGVEQVFKFFKSVRSQFWTIHPWERAAIAVKKASYTFPPPDLLASLTHLYFVKVNLFFPLLHRPTFQRSLAAGLHLTDDGFAATVLLVCAVASRFTNDERVKFEGSHDWQSSGWQWYKQVDAHKRSYGGTPTLYDLQFYSLAVIFLQGTSAPQSCWMMVGIGIRLAQDVGAHRRKKDRKAMTMEDEMWKRAFWVLVAFDRLISAGLGRPCAIQDEDFDVDFPVECDDEYWFTSEDGEDEAKPFSSAFRHQPVVFKQPPDKPSLVTAFVLFLKLNQVLGVLLRTIYSINKSKILLGFVGEKWEQHIVSELDSAMNQWVDSVPDHLRWDPNRENLQFFDQSAFIYCIYYHVQILIHRPFIPSPTRPSSTTFPSLAICTNAARSCCHIVDVQRRRTSDIFPHLQIRLFPIMPVQMAVFSAGIVLLLNIWGGKRSGIATDANKEMADVHKCMHALKACEGRYNSAGRLWDILYELASAGDLPLPATPTLSNKRDRDSDSPLSHASSPLGSPDPSSPLASAPSPDFQTQDLQTQADVLSRTMAGSRRVSRQQQKQRQAPMPQLPMYSNELGRFPSFAAMDPASSFWAQSGLVPPTPGSGPASTTVGVGHPSTSTYGAGPGAQGQQAMSPTGLVPNAGYGPPMGNYAMGAPCVVGLGGSGMLHAPHDQYGAVPRPRPVASGLQGGAAGFFAHPTTTTTTGGDMGFLAGTGGSHAHAHVGGTSGGVGMGVGTGTNTGQVDVDIQALVENDMFGMWSSAPSGFELDDWGTYLTNVSELTQSLGPGGQQHQQQQQQQSYYNS